MNEGSPRSVRDLSIVFVALLLLAALSLGLRFAHLGGLGFPIALGIAALKASLVLVFFMELFEERATARLGFFACLALVGLLLSLMIADILTRSAPPLEAPPGMSQRDRG